MTGEWESEATARQVYREWIGLYGSGPAVVVRLVEKTDRARRVLREWTVRGESVRDG